VLRDVAEQIQRQGHFADGMQRPCGGISDARRPSATIAAAVHRAGDHGPTPAGQIRFQLEFAILMLGCGRTDEARAAFARAFDLLDELDT
jgi:hypothetical protein